MWDAVVAQLEYMSVLVIKIINQTMFDLLSNQSEFRKVRSREGRRSPDH